MASNRGSKWGAGKMRVAAYVDGSGMPPRDDEDGTVVKTQGGKNCRSFLYMQ